MSRRRSPFKLKLRKQTIYSIVALGLFGTAVLVVVSLILPEGKILSRINALFSLYFGWGRILLVFTLLQLALMFAKIKISLAKTNAVLGYFLIVTALLGLSQSGNFGTSVFQTIYTLIPLSIMVFFILLLLALLGATILFQLSFGEVVEIIGDIIGAVAKFFARPGKKPAPVFIKDSQVKDQPGINTKPGAPAPTPAQGPKINTPPPLTAAAQQPERMIQNAPPTENGEAKIWEYPPLSLLSDSAGGKADRGDIKHNATVIENTLESFGITAHVAEVNTGPAVTQYALEIALGTKLSKITTLQNDLALALAAPGQLRIEAPIPGRSMVGIEIPNRSPEFVSIRKMLESDAMQQSKSKLAVALGLDVSGNPKVADIAKMPHLLIAGSTGSGKSVAINAFLTSLLYRNSPSELKLIMVDPKRVELSLYNGIPHLLTPVIVEVDKVLSALKWAITEMERRYKLFASVGVRNLEGYNEMAGFTSLPYLVIFIDEMADVMMFAPVEVEDAICRLAQMARATGIHLVLSTQRPSVDVLTGLIKANIPARMAFNVTSMIDSRVIIDTPGAEKLLGKGDMLYIPPDQSKPSRIQGAFVSDGEVHKLVDWLKSRGEPVQYTEEVTSMQTITKSGPGGKQTTASGGDPLVDQAIRIVCQYDRASASLLQRKLSIGYARAARILDTLEELGIVGPGEGSKPRDVLVRNADEYFANQGQATTTETSSEPA
ncbi:DNA translocase FtsK [Patescibacteria group bacterium]|nr:DNA translocase FtsK [Patescibacteria group bacterium]